MAGDPDDDLPEDENLPDETENEVEDEGSDARLDDDEGGDEAEAGQKPEGAEAQERVERKPSRAQKAIQELRRSAQEANERSARVERELSELRAERERSRQESPEAEAARLALMSSEDRMEYRLNKATAEHARQLQMMQFATADAADKAAFEAKGAYEPRYRKYAAEVEKLLIEERRAGRSFPRETILKFVLGDRVMKANTAPQRDQARERIRRETTPAPKGGSDRQAQRSRSGQGDTLADLEKRLDGVFI